MGMEQNLPRVAYNTRFQSLFALSRISRWSSGALYHQAAVHQHILQHTSPLNATTTMLPAILPKLWVLF